MTGHDYDSITRAIKDAPLTQQLRIIRQVVEAKDFQEFTSDALYQLDEALADMDAQAVDMAKEDDANSGADLFRLAAFHGHPL